MERLAAPSVDEQDMLERAGGFESDVRLACQATGRCGDLVIELPRTQKRAV